MLKKAIKQDSTMKILHTADWHLGQTFFDFDRKAEHLVFLDWLKQKTRELSVDVLLIAGDVFDSPNPSAESQSMYYHFLRDITAENPRLQIIVIAGNHDSAARLEAPSPLLEGMNISVRGVIRRTNDGEIDYNHLIIPLNKGGYCLAVPYLRQGDYPESETYTEGVKKMYEALYEVIKERKGDEAVLAMGHLQATGSEISDNDRRERTTIGGLECVSPEAFAQGITYTALGHLHRAQRVSGRENVRYAGAPLPMSFAEKNNRQGVTLIETGDEMSINRIEFDTPVKLLSIPAQAMPLNDVLEEISKLPDGEITDVSPYLEVKILISEPEPSLRHRIEESLQAKSVRLASIAKHTPQQDSASKTISYEQLQSVNPIDIAEDIFRRRFGGEDMPEKMKSLLQGVIQEVER